MTEPTPKAWAMDGKALVEAWHADIRYTSIHSHDRADLAARIDALVAALTTKVVEACADNLVLARQVEHAKKWTMNAEDAAREEEQRRLEAERLLAARDAAGRTLVKALEGVALGLSPVASWCDDGWMCEHVECVAGRDAIAAAPPTWRTE